MSSLRLAVIGAGHLGRYHARLLTGIDGVQLVAVADPIAAARDALATECRCESVADYHSLFGCIDAAVVATPTRFHHAVGVELARQGIHLLVEKPLTPTLAEAEVLVTVARRHGVVLQVGHIERFNPALSAAQPEISEPKYIEATRQSGYTCRSTDVGVVLDLMIHDLDVAMSLVGSPVRGVEALGFAVFGPHEDVAQTRLVFENGCVAHLTASRVSYQPARRMQVWSRDAFASIDFSQPSATVVRASDAVRRRAIDVEALTADERTHIKDHLFDDYLPMAKISTPSRNALLDELNDFVGAIRESRAPQVTGEQGRDALAVAERILASIAAHPWDGHADGRVGPLATPRVPILRGPHWDNFPATKSA